MKVQTYEVEEVAETNVEVDEQAIKLINDMGLEGQQKLICQADKHPSECAVRMPYRKMTKEEYKVFKILCPATFPLTEYGSPIPLRILQIAAHAKQFNLFKYYEVWSSEAPKDPVLVAYMEANERYYSDANRVFILGRWADELDEMPALIRKAAEVHKKLLLDKYHEIKNTVIGLINGMDGRDPEALLMSTSMPSFNG